MGKERERRIILKTDQRNILLEMGREGKFPQSQVVGTEPGSSVEGAKSIGGQYATGAGIFEALSISEEFAQPVALGDVQHLCMFHIVQ